jgi:hypothetical protein
MSDDFFTRLERQLEAAELRELNRGPALRRFVAARRFVNPRRLLSVPLAAAAAAGAVLVVLAVLGAIDKNDADRRPQPVGTEPAPRMEVIATDAERGIRFGLDGRLLTVQMLPDIPDASYETVSGARISATCGTAPPGDPPGETTLIRLWPADQTSLSYRFPRDVSSWCRLEDQRGSTVAFVRFPGVSPGARELIAETANNWARLFASSAQLCNKYTGPTACEQVNCQREGGTPSEGCRPSKKMRRWAAEHRGATVKKIAISGDRAAATLSNHGVELDTVQLRRTATGEWLINEFGASEGVTSPGLLPCVHRRATCG